MAAILPLVTTSPDVGLVTPASSFRIVLFPAPLRPINPTDSPCWISNETFFSAQKSRSKGCKALGAERLASGPEDETPGAEDDVLCAMLFALCAATPLNGLKRCIAWVTRSRK